jgi:hypothetical protein
LHGACNLQVVLEVRAGHGVSGFQRDSIH